IEAVWFLEELVGGEQIHQIGVISKLLQHHCRVKNHFAREEAPYCVRDSANRRSEENKHKYSDQRQQCRNPIKTENLTQVVGWQERARSREVCKLLVHGVGTENYRCHY